MKTFDCIQGSDEWKALRRGIPTASQFGRIITPAKGQLAAAHWDYVLELLAERMSTEPPEEKTSRDIERGINTEQEARDFYSLDTAFQVKQVGFCLTDCGRWGASPDGLIDEDGGLEIKCPSLKTHLGYLLGPKKVPDEYKAQVHGSLIVTGRKWWDFLSYYPGLDPFRVCVEPDEFTDKLRACLEEFDAIYKSARERVAGRAA